MCESKLLSICVFERKLLSDKSEEVLQNNIFKILDIVSKVSC